MKKDIHAKNYRPVIFLDVSSGTRFLVSSTVQTGKKGIWDDKKEYPLYEVEISSASHPFYTGQEKVLDIAGRVERFKARVAASEKKTKKASAGKK